MVQIITEVKYTKPLGIPRDDRTAALKMFLKNIPQDRGKQLCIDSDQSAHQVP